MYSGRRDARRSHSCSVLVLRESLLYRLSGTCAWEDGPKALCTRILRERDESLPDLAGFEESSRKRETLRQKTQVSLGKVAARGFIIPTRTP